MKRGDDRRRGCRPRRPTRSASSSASPRHSVVCTTESAAYGACLKNRYEAVEIGVREGVPRQSSRPGSKSTSPNSRDDGAQYDPAVLTPRCCAVGCGGTSSLAARRSPPARATSCRPPPLRRHSFGAALCRGLAAASLRQPSTDHRRRATVRWLGAAARHRRRRARAAAAAGSAGRWLPRGRRCRAVAVELPCGTPVRCAAACGARQLPSRRAAPYTSSARAARRSLVVEQPRR